MTRRSCSLAAPSVPSIIARRVLTRPGSGALVRMATPTVSGFARDIAVAPRQRGRFCTEEIGEPQPPHQHDRAEHAVLFPAPARGGGPGWYAQRPRDALERARQ